MDVPHQIVGTYVVLTPQDELVVGGTAEDFEDQVQTLLEAGSRHVVADLRQVRHLDSSGIRALVRGHTTARRMGGRFRIAAADARVKTILSVTRLDSVLELFPTVDAAVSAPADLTSN